VPSKSVAFRRAVRLLRATQLASEYEDAWREWEASGEAAAWADVALDGVGFAVGGKASGG